MTLLVAVAHPQYALLLSDRLLTNIVSGKPLTLSTKEGVLRADDARVLYAFTGLAEAGEFKASQWILEIIQEVGTTTTTLVDLLKRFSELATRNFTSRPEIRRIRLGNRHLMIVFVGFMNSGQIVYGEVANCTDSKTGKWLTEAKDEFTYACITATMENRPRLIRWRGWTKAVNSKDFNSLDELVKYGKPVNAVAGKAIDIIREIANRPDSEGKIGKEILLGYLSCNPNSEAKSDFYPDGASPVWHAIDTIDVRQGAPQFATWGITFKKHGDLFVDAATPRRKPCPCGSGLKFKDCHGKRR